MSKPDAARRKASRNPSSVAPAPINSRWQTGIMMCYRARDARAATNRGLQRPSSHAHDRITQHALRNAFASIPARTVPFADAERVRQCADRVTCYGRVGGRINCGFGRPASGQLIWIVQNAGVYGHARGRRLAEQVGAPVIVGLRHRPDTDFRRGGELNSRHRATTTTTSHRLNPSDHHARPRSRCVAPLAGSAMADAPWSGRPASRRIANVVAAGWWPRSRCALTTDPGQWS